MIAAHTQAVLARLREDPILAQVTFDSTVEGAPVKYCVVYSDNGRREAERFTGAQLFATFSYTIHCVGTTTAQAQFMAERVFAQLLDWRPTIGGRSCRRIRHAVSRPAQRDTDVNPPLWYTVDVFDLTSGPA